MVTTGLVTMKDVTMNDWSDEHRHRSDFFLQSRVTCDILITLVPVYLYPQARLPPEIKQRKHRPFFLVTSTRALWDATLAHLKELCSQSPQYMHTGAPFLEQA